MTGLQNSVMTISSKQKVLPTGVPFVSEMFFCYYKHWPNTRRCGKESVDSRANMTNINTWRLSVADYHNFIFIYIY